MTFRAWCAFVAHPAVLLLTADGTAAAQARERPQYERLRYEEDWSVLRDPTLRTDPLDPLKLILDSRSASRPARSADFN